jgi:DNA-binding GntR family transcriptional regulator
MICNEIKIGTQQEFAITNFSAEALGGLVVFAETIYVGEVTTEQAVGNLGCFKCAARCCGMPRRNVESIVSLEFGLCLGSIFLFCLASLTRVKPEPLKGSPLSETNTDTLLHQQVYDSLREALTAGRFSPGQKVTFRFIAGALGVSMTPVREALRRLVTEGVLEMQPNRSVRIPLMTRTKVLELRDIRTTLEGLAAEKAAHAATESLISRLRAITEEIGEARRIGDFAMDRRKLREFHFSIYTAAGQPTLLRLIEGLWLQTGPYMNLLYPDFVSSPYGPELRQRVIAALAARDADAARKEVASDIHRTLTYISGLADAQGVIESVPLKGDNRTAPLVPVLG